MFHSFRIKRQPDRVVPDLGTLSASLLERDATIPFTIRQLNDLPENIKRRVYRGLIPPALLTRCGIDPIDWTGPGHRPRVFVDAAAGSDKVLIAARAGTEPQTEYLSVELADNSLNGVELNLLVLNDPGAPRFAIDCTDDGQPTMFGTLQRNLQAEAAAMAAGLAPAQVRAGLRGSRLLLDQLDAFLASLGHRAYFLEPLTYASAWVFERRGFAYVRGHKLMDDIHREFQPGGALHSRLDGSTPFRNPAQAATVRGRAWAIHDGILDAIGERWDKLRMVIQIGRHSGVETFPNAEY